MLRRASSAAEINDLPIDQSVTVKMAAMLLGCDESTVRRLLDAEELTGHRIGVKLGGVRVYLSSIVNYRERNAIGGTAGKSRREKAPAKPRHQEQTVEHKEAMAYLKGLGLRFNPR